MNRQLDRRVAVITGAGSGIGAATARLFAQHGARLALVDRDATAVQTLSAELNSSGSEAIALVGDVGEENTVSYHLNEIERSFGGVDILFAAAGFSTGTSVPDTTLAQWESVLRANLTGSFLWSRAVLKSMRSAQRGNIILVGSQLATAGGRNNSAYLASKGAIVSLVQTMALDHAAEGIRVNAVIPGAIDTPLLQRAFNRRENPDEARAQSVARHPIGRHGSPDEIAKAALFLASDQSSFTTGSCLRVDGGWLVA